MNQSSVVNKMNDFEVCSVEEGTPVSLEEAVSAMRKGHERYVIRSILTDLPKFLHRKPQFLHRHQKRLIKWQALLNGRLASKNASPPPPIPVEFPFLF